MGEFSRHVLEVLRQPMEEGLVRISRAARTAVFPSRFMLIGAMNPCPCGYYRDEIRRCRCTPQQIARYSTRLSGPLRDRMDLTVGLTALPASELSAATGGESSCAIRTRVMGARERQLARDGMLNARLQGRNLRDRARLGRSATQLLDSALTKLSLTARGHDRVLRVSRTIADLGGDDAVLAEHLAEALQFRGE